MLGVGASPARDAEKRVGRREVMTAEVLSGSFVKKNEKHRAEARGREGGG